MRSFCVLLTALAVVILAPQPIAQSLTPFTAEDMLKVASASVLDLSEDGARVAVAIRRLEDNAETDHRRFGDPTYIAPSMVDLVIFDTRAGTSEKPFKQLMNVRQAAWTRDGARLALLTTAERGDHLPITTAWVWDAARRSLSEVPRQAGAAIAGNSELAWMPDGSKLLVAVRDEADDRASQ